MTVPSSATMKSVAAALDLAEQRQSATASARAIVEHAHVAGPIADERKVARREMRHDDFARLAQPASLVHRADDLDDDVLGAHVHAASGALVRDEAGVATAVAVGHLAAERAGNLLALVVVQALRRDERDDDAEIVQAHAPRFAWRGDMGERGGIAEQHLAAASRRMVGDELIELGLRHLERRQQRRAQEPVAQRAQPVLRAELDRRAPDDDFGIADIHAPPARGAPLGRDVVADAVAADVEDQRLAARAAGVVAP